MADIELVIKIPEEMYKWVCDVNKFSNDYGKGDFIDLIKNGIPLPKGHGRIADLDELEVLMKDEVLKHDLNEYGCLDLVKRTPIIIEGSESE